MCFQLKLYILNRGLKAKVCRLHNLVDVCGARDEAGFGFGFLLISTAALPPSCLCYPVTRTHPVQPHLLYKLCCYICALLTTIFLQTFSTQIFLSSDWPLTNPELCNTTIYYNSSLHCYSMTFSCTSCRSDADVLCEGSRSRNRAHKGSVAATYWCLSVCLCVCL